MMMNTGVDSGAPPQPAQPDPDSLKMFVGQIPKSYEEDKLREMFSEFGPVYELNVLRDKKTGESKGCCFVTFFSGVVADKAQKELHNRKVLPGARHPIQMKPADCEGRNYNVEERKLFVGMLSKKCDENDVRVMFAPFGHIEECHILRDQMGGHKGCAFVTFSTRQMALNAIRAMHQSRIMDGCTSKLVVKFADTQKEKEQKKLHQMAQQMFHNNLLQMAGLSSGLNSLNNPYLFSAFLQLAQQAANSAGTGSNVSNLGNLQLPGHEYSSSPTGQTALTMPQLAALASAVNQQQNNVGGQTQGALATNQALLAAAQGNSIMGVTPGSTGVTATTASTISQAANSNSLVAGLSGLQGGLQQTLQSNTACSTGMGPNPSLTGLRGIHPQKGAGTNTTTSMTGLTAGLQGLAAQFPNGFGPIGAFQQQAAATNQKQKEGPEGANLFIYHLPQDYTDSDLVSMFSPYGAILSAKVFIDKNTNLSKCFGFVSYDSPISAQTAIQSMNGFSVGTKRLKVQLKRSKEASKPY
ncbi:CUGBP Elav-like family member 1 isoform X7 [Diadema antillarum]|uniref:CUGBP Elav-like family member 1 isoform X7 n=1 Tax=Diadema antillarum TaxID=105358 RepID=UPI003A83C341